MLKEGSLLNKIKVKIFILVAILLICFVVNEYFKNEQKKVNKMVNKYTGEVRDKKNKISNFDNKVQAIEESLEYWQEIESKGQDFKGLKITAAKKELNRLKKKYRFSKLDVKLSKPETVKPRKGDIITTESSNIKISIHAYLDTDIYQFIYDLQNNFPGYVKINNVVIRKTEKLDISFLRKVQEQKGAYSVFSEIDFKWTEFKNL